MDATNQPSSPSSSPGRRIAVVGGGINGVMSATALRARGHEVVVFERGDLMRATSSASTKLLHGGLRYLEQGSFRLVREALHERNWWLGQAPHLCHPIQLLLPVWAGRGRPTWMLRAGLGLYDLLAGRASLGRHRWLNRTEALAEHPGLQSEGLVGAFAFWDGQMDDAALGLWAADRARAAGVDFRLHAGIDRIATDGGVMGPDLSERFDCVVNVAGPWAAQLLEQSALQSHYALDLVRGSHLIVDRPCPRGLLAEIPGGKRIAFVLPWKGRTLVGTTEVRQGLDEPVECSDDEADYLVRFHDLVMARPLERREILERFAGIRPLIRSASDPSRASREYAIERHGRLLTVFGGKWTTARALGERVAGEVAKVA
jgi:glycerol-3-phosphate dehydrogenase